MYTNTRRAPKEIDVSLSHSANKMLFDIVINDAVDAIADYTCYVDSQFTVDINYGQVTGGT